MKIIVTGGAGFIGSTVIRQFLSETDYTIFNLDKLSYAANHAALDEFSEHSNYEFGKIDIANKADLHEIFSAFKPDAVMHLAAESHVDRSIDGPDDFIQTNIVGTCNLLQAALAYWKNLAKEKQSAFRFHHISTDEVYGSLGAEGLFTEETPYSPNSPYSASKASSDHLVRAWKETYSLPVLITNCSNNYGPYQFPEKLIPLMIIRGLEEMELPVYGDGMNIRDWLQVEDHARALRLVLEKGVVGETYNIGGNAERTNIAIVHGICDTLDRLRPPKTVKTRRELIKFVQDRPGHDRRYAIDAEKIRCDLGWEPEESFETGLAKTIEWYLNNESWWRGILTGNYAGERLGLKAQKS